MLPEITVSAGTAFGLYLHVPFCATRCGYCDFNTYTAEELGGAEAGDFRFNAVWDEELSKLNAALASCVAIHTDIAVPYITRYGTGPRMSEAVAYNGILWVAGQLGEPGASVADQTRQALAAIDARGVRAAVVVSGAPERVSGRSVGAARCAC